ncbi:MAG: hypothetical protein SVQ76_01525 [Candidatus Nanohaloarchaea archaeon]|nr:hypothetical protein [Candidatus Nanohaloarchaea archaeon]
MEEGEVRETVREEVEKQSGETKRGRYLSSDQVIEEMAVYARKFYGQDKDQVGEEGYFDLVDIWLMLPAAFEEEYHEAFLHRTSILGWGSRANRHFIPYKYVLAKKGIDKALNEGFIYPTIGKKLSYIFLVKIPPLGPPLAWYSWFGPSKKEAEIWGERMIQGGGITPQEAEQYSVSSHLKFLEDKYDHLKQKYEYAKQHYQNAGDPKERRKAEKLMKQYADQINEVVTDWKVEKKRMNQAS